MKVKDVNCFNCEFETGEMNIKKDKDKNHYTYTFFCNNCGYSSQGKGMIDEDDEEI